MQLHFKWVRTPNSVCIKRKSKQGGVQIISNWRGLATDNRAHTGIPHRIPILEASDKFEINFKLKFKNKIFVLIL